MATRLGLHEGKRVKVWWPADDRPYAATVATLSSSDIELLYDDNTKATYPLAGSICERIKIGEVCCAFEVFRKCTKFVYQTGRVDFSHGCTVAQVSTVSMAIAQVLSSIASSCSQLTQNRWRAKDINIQYMSTCPHIYCL